MGVDIRGITIGPVRTKNPLEKIKTYVLKGMERSLLPEEIVAIDLEFENEATVADGPSMSYGSYNAMRRALSVAALNKSVEDVWNECEHLSDNQPYPSAIYHVLNFADNEGYIGPKAVKELAFYFEENEERIMSSMEEQYKQKLQIFINCIRETAEKNGYISYY